MSTATEYSTSNAIATNPPSKPSLLSSVLSTSTEPQRVNTYENSIRQESGSRRKHQNINFNGNHNNHHKNKRRRRGKQQQAHSPKTLVVSVGCSVCKLVKQDETPKYKCPKCRATYCSVVCCRKHKLVCPGKPGESSAASNTTTTTTSATTPIPTVKQNGTQGAPKSTDKNLSESEIFDDTDGDDDSSLEDGWEITDDMKVALRNSIWLRTELQDGGLRDMITSVIRSKKKYKSYHRRQTRGKDQRNQHGNRRQHQTNRHQSQPRHPHEELGAKRAENKNLDVFVDKLLVLADVLERQNEPMYSENGESVLVSSGASSNRNEEELEQWLRMKWDPEMAPSALALRPKQKVIPKFEPIDVSSSENEEEEEEGDEEEQVRPKDENITTTK